MRLALLACAALLCDVSRAASVCLLHVEELRNIYDAQAQECKESLPDDWKERGVARKWAHATQKCTLPMGWRHVRALQEEMEIHLLRRCRYDMLGA